MSRFPMGLQHQIIYNLLIYMVHSCEYCVRLHSYIRLSEHLYKAYLKTKPRFNLNDTDPDRLEL
jgi:hypothetical protein